MAVDPFQAVAEKAQAIGDQKTRLDSLLGRVELGRKGGQITSLPEFDAFGWARFEEFLNRLEESLNSPLLERVRGLLESGGILPNPQMLDKLKIGLTVRREGLEEITEQTVKELKKISIPEVREKAKEDIRGCFEEGKWDNLIEKVRQWHQLEQHLAPVAKSRDKNTWLYSAVFDLVLQEGPQSRVVQKLADVENGACILGGEALRQRIRLEPPESPAAPLAGVEANLVTIAKKKEEIRQLRGEDMQLDRIITKRATLKTIISTLQKEHEAVSSGLEREKRRLGDMIRRRNSLATLLKEAARGLPVDLDMKKAEILVGELEKEIETLSEELDKSLSPGARTLIDSLLGSELPATWDDQRVVLSIRELLSKGFYFEAKRRE